MDTVEIYTQLTELFRDLFASDEIVLTPRTTAKDVDGWDSITHISILVGAEARFGIKFSARDIESFSNVGDLAAAVESKLKRA